MKKIENLLFWPLALLVFYGMSKYSNTSFDLHFHDTYYIISNAVIAGLFSLWLAIVIGMFKLIRRRHHSVNKKIAITYIVLTLLLFSLSWFSTFLKIDTRGGYSDSQLDRLIFYGKVREITVLCFLAIQVIFLVYFVVQLLKKPVIQR